MGGFNLSGGYAAGEGADALEQLLSRVFAEAQAKKRAQQEDSRITIDQQRADDATALRTLDQEARAEDRTLRQKGAQQATGLKLAGTLSRGQEIGPDTIAALTGADLGETVKGPTLGSRNITGPNLTSTVNPGKGPSYRGTAGQQEAWGQDDELDRQIAVAKPEIRGRLTLAKTLDPDKRGGAITELMREQAKPTTKSPALQEYEDAKSQGYPGSFSQYQNDDANRKRPSVNVHTGGTAPASGPSPYMQERTIRNLQSVKELDKKVSGWTTGAGSLLGGLPATEARDFKAELDTLKANIAFGELTAMREASKTGGALGQVSERELALLTATRGALDPAQSPANFRTQLKKVGDSLARWEATAKGKPQTSPQQKGGFTVVEIK